MFGYILANMEKLSPEDRYRYQACYCGLCRALKNEHSRVSQLTLNYDMTFLALFLTAVYDAPESLIMNKCRLHPFKKQEYLKSEILNYAADMNIVLSYYNLIDNWTDDKSLLSLGEARLLKEQCLKVQQKYPRQCGVIRKKLTELSSIEKDNVLVPDIPAACFGDLMGEIFVPFNDSLDSKLRSFGFALGKYIYILDACIDLKKDLKKKNYNPMVLCRREEFDDILHMLMAEVVEAYRCLNIKKDSAIIENILFSGILTKYALFKKRGEKNDSGSL